MKQLIILAIFAMVVLPMVSADIIDPMNPPIRVTDTITNLADFPDYVFVQYSNDLSMCQFIEKINENGNIPGGYKFCLFSVYAVKKSDFNEYSISQMNDTQSKEFIDSKAKMVIKEVGNYETRSIMSTVKGIDNYYTIDLNSIKESPDKVVIKRDILFYFYILIPLIALIIIIFILVKKYRK